MLSRKDELLRLKEQIYQIHKSGGSEEEFNNLIINRTADPELLQSIILLHSSYKAELQDLKMFNLRSMNSIVDNLIQADMEYVHKIEEIETRLDAIEKLAKPNKFKDYFFYFVIGVIFLFSLFTMNERATLHAVDSIKSVFGMDAKTYQQQSN